MLSSVGSLGVPPSLTVAVPCVGAVVIVIAVALAPSPPKSSLFVTGILLLLESSETVAESSVAVGVPSTCLQSLSPPGVSLSGKSVGV